MASITVDSETIQTLTSNFGATIQVRDETGKVRATIIPEPTMTREEMESLFTPEQLARRADRSRPRHSSDEVFRMLGDQPCS